MKKLILAWMAVATVGAWSSQTVNFAYDRRADFSKYQTYAWHEGDYTVADEVPLAHERFLPAVGRELAAKGFQKASSNPDVDLKQLVWRGIVSDSDSGDPSKNAQRSSRPRQTCSSGFLHPLKVETHPRKGSTHS